MARRSIWEKLRESTEGPTVTLQIPREWAEELLRALATGLEIEDGGGMGDDDVDGMDMPHMEPDADDLGGPPDMDADDSPPGMLSPDEEDDSESDEEEGDDDDEEDEDEDEQDEAAGPYRPQTALGERRSLSNVYGRGRKPAKRARK